MAMGGYDHAMKTMRKQAQAAKDRRDRARATRQGGEWQDGRPSRTPASTVCPLCGTSEAWSKLVTSEHGLICTYCASEAETEADLEHELRGDTRTSNAWLVAVLLLGLPSLGVLVAIGVDAWSWAQPIFPVGTDHPLVVTSLLSAPVAGALGAFAGIWGLRTLGRHLAFRDLTSGAVREAHLRSTIAVLLTGLAVAAWTTVVLWHGAQYL